MIKNKYFFEIPVYRLDEESYHTNKTKDFNKNFLSKWSDDYLVNNKDSVLQFEEYHSKKYGGCWEFNEIIGYIKLYFTGTQIRGEYWETIAIYKVKTRKKQFECKVDKLVPEITIENKSNEKILEAIEKYLEFCQLELKKYYLNLKMFHNLKYYVDWPSVLNKVNEFPNSSQV